MRLLSVRLIISLIVGIALVSFAFSYYEVLGQKRALRSDVERRDEILGESLVGNVERWWNTGSAAATQNNKDLQKLVQRFGNRENLLGVVICDQQGAAVAVTPELANAITTMPAPMLQVLKEGRAESSFLRLGACRSTFWHYQFVAETKCWAVWRLCMT